MVFSFRRQCLSGGKGRVIIREVRFENFFTNVGNIRAILRQYQGNIRTITINKGIHNE